MNTNESIKDLLSFKDYVKWKKVQLFVYIKLKVLSELKKLIVLPITTLINESKHKIHQLKFKFVVNYIRIKLILLRKSNIQIKQSPYSESTYISYKYDGLLKNYISIRVSCHTNKKSKADIHIYI